MVSRNWATCKVSTAPSQLETCPFRYLVAGCEEILALSAEVLGWLGAPYTLSSDDMSLKEQIKLDFRPTKETESHPMKRFYMIQRSSVKRVPSCVFSYWNQDKIFRLALGEDDIWTICGPIQHPTGSRPRHVVGQTAFRHPRAHVPPLPTAQSITTLSELPLLPDDLISRRKATSVCGKYLYATYHNIVEEHDDRSDTIVVYAVADSGTLEFVRDLFT
ncbi:hypothetical protein BKA62DRAFT_770825 [Auriculariales sp. MPI-PUGE-AT-0066]|nr:hypothetical protein BKA62DRAFT_770825 [Auriculariales sp. MPI-PUGE-AT-0066]